MWTLELNHKIRGHLVDLNTWVFSLSDDLQNSHRLYVVPKPRQRRPPPWRVRSSPVLSLDASHMGETAVGESAISSFIDLRLRSFMPTHMDRGDGVPLAVLHPAWRDFGWHSGLTSQGHIDVTALSQICRVLPWTCYHRYLQPPLRMRRTWCASWVCQEGWGPPFSPSSPLERNARTRASNGSPVSVDE